MTNVRFLSIGLLCACCLMIGAGCATRPHSAPQEVAPTHAEQTFRYAESAFAEGQIREAMDAYERFITRYPDHPHTPTALFKLATLKEAQSDPVTARLLLERLLNDFPGSPLRPEADVARCASFYAEGDYKRTVQCVRQTRTRIDTPRLRQRLDLLEADALFADNRPVVAIDVLSRTLSSAPQAARESLLDKIRGAAKTIPVATLSGLLATARQPEPAATLRFVHATRLAESGRYRDAEAAFTAFATDFPDHTKALIARDLAITLSEKPEIDPYAIGCLLPLSGRFAPFGIKALRGVELAIAIFDEQNQGNSPIRVFIEDTASDPDTAAEAVNRLEARKVMGILGPILTAPEAAMAATDAALPMVVLTQKEAITQAGPTIFRNFLTPEMQVNTLVHHAVTRQGIQRFALLYPADSYGRTFMELFWDAVEAHGAIITGAETYAPGVTDFAEPINRLVGMHYPVPEDLRPQPEPAKTVVTEDIPMSDIDAILSDTSVPDGEDEPYTPEPVVDFEAIFIPDGAKQVGMIAPQLAYNDVDGVQLLGTNLWHEEKLIQFAKDYVQNALICEGFFADSARPQVRNFVDRYRETYGEPPGFLEAVTFDTAMMLFSRLGETPLHNRQELREALITMPPFAGVTGITRFREDREAEKPLFLLRVEGSTFRELP